VAPGDAAFAARGDAARLAAALEAYRRAATLSPGEPEVELRLARAEAWRAAGEKDRPAEAWSAAARAAERALRRLAPEWAAEVDAGRSAAAAAARVEGRGAEALYWLALATFSGAQARGFAAVLVAKDVALASMERAAALDERIDRAGPHRALGAWLAALPSAAEGGAAAARAHFERARELFPGYQATRVREAETLCVLLQDRRRFRSLLGEVLASGDETAPEMAPENALARRQARELLAREDRLF
jgi:hypothetical protein